MVEHYLHTVTPNHDSDKRQSLNGESPFLRPDFCPDPGAKSRPRPRRFVRIALGLYRYGGTGEIYACEKIAGRNRWRKLNTSDKKTAVALKAIASYAESQNGNHVVMFVPDELSKSAAITPGKVVDPPSTANTPRSTPQRRSMTIRALIEELKSQWKHLAPSTQKVREALMSKSGPTYITFTDISNLSAAEAKSILQLKYEPTHFATFDTLQLVDDLKIPGGLWNTSPIPEPITTTFPEFGSGGATQAITTTPIQNYSVSPFHNP